METHASDPSPEPRVLVSWPCARCGGSAVDQATGRRCTRCVNSPGTEREELVELARFKQLLRAAS